jgi:hypothetical protein
MMDKVQGSSSKHSLHQSHVTLNEERTFLQSLFMVNLTVFKGQFECLIKIQKVSVKGCEYYNLERGSERNISFQCSIRVCVFPYCAFYM